MNRKLFFPFQKNRKPDEEKQEQEDLLELDTQPTPETPIEMISAREGAQVMGAVFFVLILLLLTLYTTKCLGYF